MSTPDAGARAARRKILFMFGFPLLIVGLATAVYFTGIGVPDRTTNKGVLLIPPRQLDDMSMSRLDGTPWKHADGGGWGLVTVGEPGCYEACRERLYLSRQIRLAIGRDADRIRRIFIALDEAPAAALADVIAAEHPDLAIVRASSAELAKLLSGSSDPRPIEDRPMFIVDPRGFLMMYYLPSHDGRATISDLRFLLKHSYEKVR
jgi:hypothetical protein